MSTEFTREDRYIVFKLSDVERYLTDADRTYLAMMKNEIDAGRDCANKPPFKGLIVESDWPEYEPTWKAIEARVTGAQPAPSIPDDVMRAAKRYRFLRAAKNIPISTEAARDPVVYDAAIDAAMLARAPEDKP